jgi:hypothetical protein
MKRIDIVRQQRAIPLLNELLFSVIDSKPDDPLAYLIDALEKVATDVKLAKGRLSELVRGRKQLNETLLVAKRHHKPAGLTLLLHASGGSSGPARHPLLHDLYHNEALLHAAPPAVKGVGADDRSTVVNAEERQSNAAVILPPLSAAVATPSDVGGARPDDTYEEPTSSSARRIPELRIQCAVSTAPWDAQVNAALKSPIPTDALRALYSAAEAARGGQTAPPLSGIEVLLVSAVHATNSFTAATPRNRSAAATPRASSGGIDTVYVSPVHQSRRLSPFPLLRLLIDSDTAMMHKVPCLLALTSAAESVVAGVESASANTSNDAAFTNFQPLDFLRLACDVSSVAGHFSALEVLFQTKALSRKSSSADSHSIAVPLTVSTQPLSECIMSTQPVAHSLAAVAAAASHPLPYLDFLVAASQQRPGTTGDPSLPSSPGSNGLPSSHASTTTFSCSTNNITRLLKPFVDASPASFPFLGKLLTILCDDAGTSDSSETTPYLRMLADIVEEQQSATSLLRLVAL